MVDEGVEVPHESECGNYCKVLASRVLAEGPPPWGQNERDQSRYAITDMVEDIREPRNSEELRIVISNLYSAIADHFLRSQNRWSAKGKHIPRRLMKVDPEFHKRFAQAFEAAFTNDNTSEVIQICEHVLEQDGGFLFQGYARDAPKEWRMPDP